ncbi:MAG: YceI family protein [bacterium]
MRKLMISGLLLALLSISASAQTWEFDVAHSGIDFKVSHMVISKVSGEFDKFEGKITNFDGADFTKAGVEVTIETSSINTENERRDTHLRSGDFFLADSFPTITFVSTKVTTPVNGDFQITGDLTIRGVTKSVTLAAHLNGTVQDPWGNTRAGFSASTTINRQDYGVSWSQTLDAGGLVAGDEVEISLEVEAVKEK